MSPGVDPAARAPVAGHREQLRARAAALARVPRPPRSGELVQAVVFSLGDERFAIDGAHVLEVAVLRELTPLPGAPAPLFGVTHWRGRVLTLLDLRAELSVRVRGLTDLGRIIVLDGPDRVFAIVVDAVQEMVDIDMQQLSALPPDEGGRASLLRGMAQDALLVMDEGALLERFGTAQVPQQHQGTRRTR
jgi:purine-binding chemotaxis protein CheW